MLMCSKCKRWKGTSEFSKDNTTTREYQYTCKKCKYNHNKEYIKTDRGKILTRNRHLRYAKSDKGKTASRKSSLKYRQNHKEKVKTRRAKYRQNHKEEINKYSRERKKTDLNYKIVCDLRTRLNQALNGKYKSAHTLDLLGCSVEELKQHLEKQFKDGMTWDNHNFYGWHIDHIRPCASFDLTKPEQQQECFNYKNLQPLWAKENLSKHDKWDDNSHK